MILIGSVLAAALGILVLVCLIRVLLGPTLPDRVVAMDAISTMIIALMVVSGFSFRETIFVDVAIVYAMLSFVSTLYVSRYIEVHS
ncbi:MAG: cation:proton antiporter [Candidatus Aenigmarchaeota archaeon]|nr:cation:proton antiporter [Candidatus Aenigmarchaeota archaeon]